MESFIEQRIRQLAGNRCEYCCIPEEGSKLRHVLDHIIARQHGGQTVFENLALCCGRCNRFKGPNIAGIDGQTGTLVPLFNPRRESWEDHLQWSGAALSGITPIGRATIIVLAINLPVRVAAREALMAEGRFFSDAH